MGSLCAPMIVYLLTNKVNSKVYVGQHRGFTLSKRWNKKLDNVHVNNHLTGAINKYGAASFSRKIICFATCQQELDLLEQFWIAIYKATDPKHGYNQQSGGRMWRGQYTPRLKQLMSEGVRKAWQRKSKKERWEHAFATKLTWLMRSEHQRKKITTPMHKVPHAATRRPFTKKHKAAISKALIRYHQERRKEKG